MASITRRPPSPRSTREVLLDAAASAVVAEGLQAATTANLARRSRLSEGALYRHFPTKQKLIEALFERTWEILIADLEKRLPPRSEPDRRLREFVPCAIALMADHPGEAQVLRAEFAHLVAQSQHCVNPPGSLKFVGLLEDAIRQAQKARKANLHLDAAVSALLIFNGLSRTWATLPRHEVSREMLTNICRFFEAALFPSR